MNFVQAAQQEDLALMMFRDGGSKVEIASALRIKTYEYSGRCGETDPRETLPLHVALLHVAVGYPPWAA